jgi:hypothetical protein
MQKIAGQGVCVFQCSNKGTFYEKIRLAGDVRELFFFSGKPVPAIRRPIPFTAS